MHKDRNTIRCLSSGDRVGVLNESIGEEFRAKAGKLCAKTAKVISCLQSGELTLSGFLH